MPNGNPTEAARRRAYNRRNDFLLCLCENVIENDFGNRIWLSCVSWWMASISISTRQQNMTGGRIKRKTNKQEISYFFLFFFCEKGSANLYVRKKGWKEGQHLLSIDKQIDIYIWWWLWYFSEIFPIPIHRFNISR